MPNVTYLIIFHAECFVLRGHGSALTHRPRCRTPFQIGTRCEISRRAQGLPSPLTREARARQKDYVLQLTHMETIGIRELQQHASAALRRVARGETLGVTDRGRLVAVLSSPSGTSGVATLIASGRVQPARRHPVELPLAVASERSASDVLDELREDR